MTDMALNIEYEDWIREKRADIAQHNLSIQANIAALSQRLWKAEQTLEQVRRLHRNHDDDCPLIPLCARQGRCDECGQDWPCATIRILDGGDE